MSNNKNLDRRSFFENELYSHGGQKVNVLPEQDNELYLMTFSNKNLIKIEKLKELFDNGDISFEELKVFKVKNEGYSDLEKYKNLLILRYAVEQGILSNGISLKIKNGVALLREQNLDKEFNKNKGFLLIDAIAEMSKYTDISFGFGYNSQGNLVLDLAIEEDGYTNESSVVLKKGDDYIFTRSDLDTIKYYIKTAQVKIEEKENRERVVNKYHSLMNEQFEPEEREILKNTLKEPMPGW